MSENEFREICQVVFDNASPGTEEEVLLQQLLVLSRYKLGHARPGTGAFALGGSESATLISEIVGLLLMRREPFFETTRIINEYLTKTRGN